jgi:hypothetical protein
MNEKLMKALGFSKQLRLIKDGKCPICSKAVNLHELEEKGDEARNEFEISGMCYTCQVKVFGK